MNREPHPTYPHRTHPGLHLNMPAREMHILTAWSDGMTLDAIGATLSITGSRVQALRNKALRRARWSYHHATPEQPFPIPDPYGETVKPTRAGVQAMLAEFAPTIDTSKIKGE